MNKKKKLKFRNNFLSIAFAFMITLTSVVQPVMPVLANEPDANEVVEDPNKDTVDAETPTESGDPVIEVEVDPTETGEPTETPTVSETDEPTIPTEEPTETPAPAESEEPAPEVENEPFEKVSLEEINWRIAIGENLVVLSGLDSDEAYKATKDAYNEIYQTFDDEVKVHFVELDVNSITGEDASVFVELGINDDDKELLSANINSLRNGEAGHGLIIKSQEEFIQKVDSIMVLTEEDEVTYNLVVRQHISMTYNSLLNQPESNISMFTIPSDVVGNVWNYAAKKEAIQEFTAPYSGIYHIDLWGADGDSDTGANAQGANNGHYTSGIGGQAGHTSGDIYLDAGQTIYLGLGFRNEMRSRIGYNGGGAGYPQSTGYRAGGGDAGAIYLTERGTGKLTDYANNKDEVLMVAGGGGGAEDYYGTGLDWNAPYWCLYNACINSYGGNGGPNPTGGVSQGATGTGGAYKFGIGQNYASYQNASSGGGGGGWVGGTSGVNDSLTLRGGTGGGGSSYINEDVITNGVMENGDKLEWTYRFNGEYGWDNGQNARAKIVYTQVKTQKLTINYYDVNDGSVIHEKYEAEVPYGDTYSVPSPDISGYSVVDADQKVVTGQMPEHDVVIDVYYDYTKLTIYYQELGTGKTLAPTYENRQKTGTPYDVTSPNVANYERYEGNQDHVAGNKLDHDEEYYVYYVPVNKPTKHIVAVNGSAISQEKSDAGVEVKYGDIVTYEIRFENLRNVAVNKTFTDALNKNVFEYVGNVVGDNPTVTDSATAKTLTWKPTIAAKGTFTVRFDVKIVDTDGNHETVDNWTRKDPLVQYEVVKSSKPVSGSFVGFGEEIEYTLLVRNTGSSDVHNIVVVDYIPEHTEYLTTNSGAYNSTDKYVKFVIDELPAGNIKKLTFKVKVTTKVEDDSVIDILNKAFYDNYNDDPNDHGVNDVVNDGHETNEVDHHIVGPIVSVSKDSNPTSGTVVAEGQEITYYVTATNTGTVDSEYVRLVDQIPVGTTFVPGSLKLTNTNASSNEKYLVSYGSNYDVKFHYRDNSNGYYYLENVIVPAIVEGRYLEVTFPTTSVVSMSSGSLPTGWTVDSSSSGKIKYNISANATAAAVAEYLENVHFEGTLANSGSIGVKVIGPVLSVGYTSTGTNMNVGYNIANKEYQIKNANITLNSASHPVSKLTVTLPTGLSLKSKSMPTGWTESKSGNVYTYTVSGTNNKQANINTFLNSMKFSGTYGTLGNIAVSVSVNYVESTTKTVNMGSQYRDPGDHKTINWTYDAGQAIIPTSYYVGAWNHTPSGSYTLRGSNDKSTWTNLANSSNSAGGNLNFTISTSNAYRYYRVVQNSCGGSYCGQFSTGISVTGKINTTINYNKTASSAIPNSGPIVSTNYTLSTDLPSTSNSSGCAYIPGGNYVECVTSDLRAANSNGGVADKAVMSFRVKVDTGTVVDVVKNVGLYETSFNDPGLPGDTPNLPTNKTNMVYHPLSEEPAADMSITAVKSANPVSGTTVQRYQKIEYSIAVTNDGDVDIPYAVIRDVVPEKTSYVAKSATNGGVYVDDHIEWVLKDLAVGETRTVKFMVRVNGVLPNKDPIKNVATYGMFVDDPGEAGLTEIDTLPNTTNEVEHPLFEREHPDDFTVEVTKSSNPVSGTLMNRQEDIQYSITVKNTNTGRPNVILVKDMIPEGTTFKSLDGYAGGSSSEYLNISEYVSDDRSFVEYVINYLEPNDTVTLNFTVTIDKETPLSEIINVAKWHFDQDDQEDTYTIGEIDDSVFDQLTNNTIHPLSEPTIIASKDADPVSGSVVARGKNIKYIISVTNDSDVLANYVTFADPIPEEVTYVASSIIMSEVSDEGAYNATANQIQAVFKNMQPHETRTISFTVEVNENARGGDFIYNTAYFGHHFDNPGAPGRDDFDVPTEPTNTVVHTVDIRVDVIPTGGAGYSSKLMVAGLVAAVIGIIAYKKKEDEE